MSKLTEYVPSRSWLVFLHKDGTVVGVLAFSSGPRSETYLATFEQHEMVSGVLTTRQQAAGKRVYPFQRAWLTGEFRAQLPDGVEAADPIPLHRMIRARLSFDSFLGRSLGDALADVRWDGLGL